MHVCVSRDNMSLQDQLQVLQEMGSGAAARGGDGGKGSKYEDARRNWAPFSSHLSPPGNSSAPLKPVLPSLAFCFIEQT